MGETVAHVDLKVCVITVVCVHDQRREQGFEVLAGEGEGTVSEAPSVFVEARSAGGAAGGRRSARRGALEEGRVESMVVVVVMAGETREAEAVVEFRSVLSVAAYRLAPSGLGGLSLHAVGVARRRSALVGVVDEVAPRTVWAEADGVESATGLGFVLGVARQVSQLVVAVRKLALLAVLASSVFLEGPAELRLVAGGVDLRARLLLQLLGALAVGAVAELVLLVHDGVLLHAADAVGAGGVLIAVCHGLHVAGGVSTEES